LDRLDVERGSDGELALIERFFPEAGLKTFQSDLSRGFSPEHAVRLQQICDLAGYEFDISVWIRKSSASLGGLQRDGIRFGGPLIRTDQDFYDQLEERYRSANHYECIRVGGLFSRSKNSWESSPDNEIGMMPNKDSIRWPYVRVFWQRMTERSLKGVSVHVVRTVDRLAELWACAEILRLINRHEDNPVYMTPIVRTPASHDYPVMGVRVIDKKSVLFSIPPQKLGESQYSSWIESLAMASFASKYVHWAMMCSHRLTSMPSGALEDVMLSTFNELKQLESQSFNYGKFADFRQVRLVKDAMVGSAMDKEWFPVVA
jgi:hypothetical protein